MNASIKGLLQYEVPSSVLKTVASDSVYLLGPKPSGSTRSVSTPKNVEAILLALKIHNDLYILFY